MIDIVEAQNMGADSLAVEFVKLFRGRGDAIGTWSGGSLREPLTWEHFNRHLQSANQSDWIGVYPHLGDRGVSWGCVDIDGKDFDHDWDRMRTLARNLQTVLQVKGISAWRERTRNGFHLWVFPETGLAPAADMRRALMAACKACGYNPKEVNPKQENLMPGKLGNYVRLPYYGALRDDVILTDRYFELSDTTDALSLEEFIETVDRTPLDNLAEVAKLWTPPPTVHLDGPPPEDVTAVLHVIDGFAFTIWRDGPLDGSDRSNTLLRLGHRLAATGISMPDAFAVVKDADRRWGKFADRPDCDEQIGKIIEHCYSAVS